MFLINFGFSTAFFSSTQFVIVFLSCIVLTLRAAFYDVEIADREDDEGKEDSRDSTVPAVQEAETKVLSGSDGDEFELSLKPASRWSRFS